MFILIIHLILIIQCCVTLIWYLIDMLAIAIVSFVNSGIRQATYMVDGSACFVCIITTNIIMMLLRLVVKLFMVQRDDFLVLCWWAALIHFSYANHHPPHSTHTHTCIHACIYTKQIQVVVNHIILFGNHNGKIKNVLCCCRKKVNLYLYTHTYTYI